MTLEVTFSEKMYQLDTSGNGDEKYQNQPIVLSKACANEFAIKRRRTKLKNKDDKMSQDKNKPNDNVQKYPQVSEKHILFVSSLEIVVSPSIFLSSQDIIDRHHEDR